MGFGTVVVLGVVLASVELPVWKLVVPHHAGTLAGVGQRRPEGISVPFRPFVGQLRPFVVVFELVVVTFAR